MTILSGCLSYLVHYHFVCFVQLLIRYVVVCYLCVCVPDVPVCGMSGRERPDIPGCLKEVHELVLNKVNVIECTYKNYYTPSLYIAYCS
jgi:hypothetical protein